MAPIAEKKVITLPVIIEAKQLNCFKQRASAQPCTKESKPIANRRREQTAGSVVEFLKVAFGDEGLVVKD